MNDDCSTLENVAENRIAAENRQLDFCADKSNRKNNKIRINSIQSCDSKELESIPINESMKMQ
jgi:hypothetical protein